MGQVIAIKDVTRVATGDPVFLFIDECYERLAKLPGFTVRPGQKELSADICRALLAGEPIAAEAPTGTGKTIAYLVGAIAASEKLRTSKDVPIVVATATVGLQSQVLTGDLPRLVEAGIINEGSSQLAKGRGRYFCIASAERLVQEGLPSTQTDFFQEEANASIVDLSVVPELLAAWHGSAWSGDVDAYKAKVDDMAWKHVQAESATCLGHKCEFYSSCPFFNARRSLSTARIVIANHDLVLADLAMAKEGQDPLFPGKYLLVFDEAHHLPDKAVDIAAGTIDFNNVLEELPKLSAVSRLWQKHPEMLKLLEKSKLSLSDLDTYPLLNALEALRDEVDLVEVDEDSNLHRFEKGRLPPGLANALRHAAGACAILKETVHDGSRAVKQSNLAEKNAVLKPLMQELLYLSAGALSLLSGLDKALRLLTGSERAVRWVEKSAKGTTLNTSPLEGADVLRELLWDNERVSVAAVSATLRDFDGFERFKTRSGAPAHLRTATLPHIFPYRENTMYLVSMRHTPRQGEKDEYVSELRESMPRFINEGEGTLVLFPSRVLMNAIAPTLRKLFPGKVLCQGEKNVKDLVVLHKSRIDEGKGSILCGLATMAEGLDLPGAYCTHVIICSLPFAVPTNPIEAELREELGKDYFNKRAMPDTLTKLTQMTGRLMRRETDRGRITVFDRRLHTTHWGKKLLTALPNFTFKAVAPTAPPLHSI